MKENQIHTKNNFDLIRLFAATQVALTHIAHHLQFESIFIDWLSIFPGVPIFFFISGFLIYSSYSRLSDNPHRNKIFFKNRFLRLYPGLFGCFTFCVLLIYISGYIYTQEVSLKDFLVWPATSLTFFQFYNPDFLRGFGLGAINGSLWTISVELQFYFFTPFIFLLLNQRKKELTIFFM